MKKKTKEKKRKRRPQNPVAKDLRTPKYKMRVVQDKRKKAIEKEYDDYCEKIGLCKECRA